MKEPVVVAFNASWCRPCMKMKKHFEAVSDMNEDKPISYVKLEVNEFHDQAKEYKISAIPSYRVFKDGEMVDKLSKQGALDKPEKEFKEMSDKALKLK